MASALRAAACFHAETPVRGTLLADIDLAGCERPRAVQARLRQGMAGLSVALLQSADVRQVFTVIWPGPNGITAREMNVATAAAESVHRRVEMLRGEPLGVAVVFADGEVPIGRVRQRLRLSARTVPDGVTAMTWSDLCAYGARACAAAYHL